MNADPAAEPGDGHTPKAGAQPLGDDRWRVASDYPASQLGTAHPLPFLIAAPLVAGGGIAVLIAVGGYPWWFRAIFVVVFLGIGVVMALPGMWSLRHRDRARAGARKNWDEQRRFLEQNPWIAFGLLPLLAGVAVAFRSHSLLDHPHAWSQALCGLGAAVLVSVLMVVERAVLRRRAAGRDVGNR